MKFINKKGYFNNIFYEVISIEYKNLRNLLINIYKRNLKIKKKIIIKNLNKFE